MSFVVRPDSEDHTERVLAALRHDRWMTADEVASRTHITATCACRTLRALREAGEVRSAAGRWTVTAGGDAGRRAA